MFYISLLEKHVFRVFFFFIDDKKYIATIKEARVWGSGYFLRLLFMTLLIASCMYRPKHVWENTWQWLSDGILYEQKRLANNPSILYPFINCLIIFKKQIHIWKQFCLIYLSFFICLRFTTQ